MSTQGDGKECPAIADLVSSAAAMTLQGNGEDSLDLVASAAASDANSGNASASASATATDDLGAKHDLSAAFVIYSKQSDIVQEQVVQEHGVQEQLVQEQLVQEHGVQEQLVQEQVVQEHVLGYFGDPYYGYFDPYAGQYVYYPFDGLDNYGEFDGLDNYGEFDGLDNYDEFDGLDDDEEELVSEDDDEEEESAIAWLPKPEGSVRDRRKWSQARKAGGVWTSQGFKYFSFGTFGDTGIEF